MARSLAPSCARAALLAAMVFSAQWLAAAERPKGIGDRIDPSHETVDLFAGVEKGQLEVTVIPKDSRECRVMVKNRTDRPLNVRLPEAVAAVPALAQFLPQGPNNNANNNAAPQNLSTGFPPNNFQNLNPMNNNNNNFFNVPNNRGQRGQNPMFGPLFNIAPEKVAQFHLDTVCLDHGKPDPKPQIPYQLKPLESVTASAEVRELTAMLGRGEIGQRAAQAAAWHFANGMTWEQLKSKELTMALGRIREPYFSAKELAAARKAAEQIAKAVSEAAKTASTAGN